MPLSPPSDPSADHLARIRKDVLPLFVRMHNF
jgi:hypothetical protein